MSNDITLSDLIVYRKEEPIMVISQSLLDKQNAWHNLKYIKMQHEHRLEIESMILDNIDNPLKLQAIKKMWTNIQFNLQSLWGFNRDARYHRFWEMPGCSCPKLDNQDAYPSGLYVVSSGCKLHGDL